MRGALSHQGQADAAGEGTGGHGPALMLSPSRGLGGGIERYVQTVESAFTARGVSYHRVDLQHPGPAGHRAVLAAAAAVLAETPEPTRLVVAHRALLPVAALLARNHRVQGISVLCYGIDVWGQRARARRHVESWLLRRRDVRVVTISSFTAGALFPVARSTILPPGLSRDWFAELADAAAADRPQHAGPRLMTAFRLADWRNKGLPQLLDAIAALRLPNVRLTVCGSGEPTAELRACIDRFPWCTLRPGLTDRELAVQFATADLFILATRTRAGKLACGEGFGLVLLEAQVAGTAVVGPAHGGSPDAYLEGVTGMTPRDESVESLSRVLHSLLSDAERLSRMGARGALWARDRFAPDQYATLAVGRLL
jgi:phosphatidyl-myo-inositol dimannoside synthase